MLRQNEPIVIYAVDNGFIVRDNAHRDSIPTEKVFQTMKELKHFIDHHFDHRCGCVEVDE